MIFNWDIDNWIRNELHPELRDTGGTNISLLRALLKPVKILYDAFIGFRADTIKKMHYNGQVIVLENVLNDMFDPSLRRIEIVTDSDILLHQYIFTTAEATPLYIRTLAEYSNPVYAKVYINTSQEYGTYYDFLVRTHSGWLTAEQIVRLKATVNYYKIAGKRPHYLYTDTNQAF